MAQHLDPMARTAFLVETTLLLPHGPESVSTPQTDPLPCCLAVCDELQTQQLLAPTATFLGAIQSEARRIGQARETPVLDTMFQNTVHVHSVFTSASPLRTQTEKQRIIWAYKILFLDVLFPLDLKKVIFLDADQVIRTDIKQLADLDLRVS